ncbi:MAG: glycosyltransferase family 2 protein [Gammaproteobacteria bacterium]|jgi:glycosyltransferase involved in cell wall biosynthesis
MKLITFVSPCYNEEGNVAELYRQIKQEMSKFPQYKYEFIFIDNNSQDNTVKILKEIAAQDKNVKIIVNSRNFGHIRSPYYALMQAQGDAVVLICADLQDPPNLIGDFIQKWEEGYKIVKAVKEDCEESWLMRLTRKSFYSIINRLSGLPLTKNYYGYGLYDKKIIETLRKINDPYPYFRGLISDIGFEHAEVMFRKPGRKRGITKNNFYTLYDLAMLGIVNYSKVPLRLATMFGFLMAGLSLLIAFLYIVLKILFWNFFPAGMAPMLIAIFFFSSVQLFFIGILGEYIGCIHTQVQNHPLVVEKERINFD